MSSGNVIVRRSRRHDVVLPARIRVGPEHQELMKFSAGSADRDGWVKVDVVDFAAGGVGIMSPVFVPRRAVLELEIFPVGGLGEGATPGGVLLRGTVRVQRTLMTDRRPAYMLGTSFAETNQELDRAVDQMLTTLEAA